MLAKCLPFGEAVGRTNEINNRPDNSVRIFARVAHAGRVVVFKIVRQTIPGATVSLFSEDYELRRISSSSVPSIGRRIVYIPATEFAEVAAADPLFPVGDAGGGSLMFDDSRTNFPAALSRSVGLGTRKDKTSSGISAKPV